MKTSLFTEAEPKKIVEKWEFFFQPQAYTVEIYVQVKDSSCIV